MTKAPTFPVFIFRPVNVKFLHIIIWLGILLFAQSVFAAAESTMEDTAAFAYESPAVRALLQRAVSHERDDNELDGDWQAASLYCQASRLGSAEAQYRLGMLYAFGKGVPKSQALGAALFSLAASQGHYEAQKMLDTIDFTSTEVPACLLTAELPEKAAFGADAAATASIDLQISNLPKSKRWVVELVSTLADWYKVDPKLILSMIAVESNFNIQAKSQKAAMGLMQLIPATAERFNVRNAYDASQNVKGGIAYMRWLLSYYQGDLRLAVAGYNAGERAVDRYKGIPPYAETKQYVKKVLELYKHKRHPYDNSLVQPSPLVMK